MNALVDFLARAASLTDIIPTSSRKAQRSSDAGLLHNFQ